VDLVKEILSADMVAPLILVLLIVIAAFGRSLRVDVKTMTAELKPNGGKSSKDIITRLEDKLDAYIIKQKERSEKFKKRLDDLEAKIDGK
jgi:hypothetical protein